MTPDNDLNISSMPQAIVVGALNIDLILQGLPRLAAPDEQVNADHLHLAAGGKGRNIASMLAAWLPTDSVFMLGKLVMDRQGLYQIPLQSLNTCGVTTDSIVLDSLRPSDLPTFSIFLNTTDGLRASYYIPGANESLSPADIDQRLPLFQMIAQNQGIVVLTLEMPVQTAAHIIRLSDSLGMRVMLDPGGQPPHELINFAPLFDHPIACLKPNTQEATRLTGIPVTDFQSARKAAELLLSWGVSQLVITHGAAGAYCFSEDEAFQVVPVRSTLAQNGESTGCGDQAMAVLCASLLAGKSFKHACQVAISASTLQYYQPGLLPIQPDDLRLQQARAIIAAAD